MSLTPLSSLLPLKVAEPPYSAIEFMQSWRDINQGYDFRFYDDEACVEFVKREFPQYLDAYNGLPKVCCLSFAWSTCCCLSR